MTRTIAILALLVAGCTVVGPDEPQDEATGLTAVAEESARDYLRGVAAVYRDESWQTPEELEKSLTDGLNKNDASWKPLGDARTKAYEPNGEFDAAAARRANRAIAEGFERVAK